MLEVAAIQVNYGHIEALRDVSLSVADGEAVAVLGANGAGKTTLMQAIAGAQPTRAGTITLAGRSLGGVGADRRARLGMSLCPEGRGIFSSLSVERNLLLGGIALRHRVGSAAARGEIAAGLDRAYELFPILRERRALPGSSLSGGQQQMLAIARALMSKPSLLMLDEPSLGLAPKIVGEVYALLRRLHAEGQTLLIVEESAERALKLVDRAYVLRMGRNHLEGDAKTVRDHPELMAAYLGDQAVLEA
jgi:branched-chain amino acid transport system ATP-binding protein